MPGRIFKLLDKFLFLYKTKISPYDKINTKNMKAPVSQLKTSGK
jgi:hypothetical protein